MSPSVSATPRTDWRRDEVEALFELPFGDLVFAAAGVHRANFDAGEIQLSQLLSVKTGGCPEDCGYCSQSAKFDTGLKASRLMDPEAAVAEAARAKAGGAQRFCMGAAWRDVKDRDLAKLEAMVAGVKALGLETCATLGMLAPHQARALAAAGLDFYNHNLDTAPEDYGRIVSTRTYEDRLETLSHVRDAGISVCCGGIVGMGETRAARAGLLHALATLPEHPESLPINALVPIPGTPLGASEPLDGLEFVRTIAVARIVCPKAVVRLAAGRVGMSRELQALCFLAGANSIFIGAKLLTTPLPGEDEDARLLADLGLRPMRGLAPIATL
ncbi:MAG TPA: biotin synthase BioB [Caulobacteraceae bacterium]|nr:biotin synthase BioB [Caulobacteraceae bacterium]